jgi:hypothetical protein
MVAKAEAGTLTVNEASVLRNLLRDNGMTMGLREGVLLGPGAALVGLAHRRQ